MLQTVHILAIRTRWSDPHVAEHESCQIDHQQVQACETEGHAPLYNPTAAHPSAKLDVVGCPVRGGFVHATPCGDLEPGNHSHQEITTTPWMMSNPACCIPQTGYPSSKSTGLESCLHLFRSCDATGKIRTTKRSRPEGCGLVARLDIETPRPPLPSSTTPAVFRPDADTSVQAGCVWRSTVLQTADRCQNQPPILNPAQLTELSGPTPAAKRLSSGLHPTQERAGPDRACGTCFARPCAEDLQYVETDSCAQPTICKLHRCPSAALTPPSLRTCTAASAQGLFPGGTYSVGGVRSVQPPPTQADFSPLAQPAERNSAASSVPASRSTSGSIDGGSQAIFPRPEMLQETCSDPGRVLHVPVVHGVASDITGPEAPLAHVADAEVRPPCWCLSLAGIVHVFAQRRAWLSSGNARCRGCERIV